MVAACPFPANRGTPSRILRMSEALSRLGHEIHIVTYHYGIAIPTRDVYIHRIPSFPYQQFEPGPSLTKLFLLDPLLAYKLYKTVRQFNIDLIHAHHFEGALAGLFVRIFTGKKVIYDAHTTLEGELHHYDFIQLNQFKRVLDRKLPQLSDHVIAVSDTIRIFLEACGVDREKIDVVPTGVYPEVFENGNSDRIRKQHQLGDRPIVMYTGSLAAFQGVDYLIQVMQKIVTRHPDAMLLLVGDSDADRYEKLCRQENIADNVLITNKTPFSDVPDYLSAADVAVCPRTECPGIPQKLVNYMAARKAIVSFADSAKLLHHQHNGLVIKNGDTAAMAEAIISLIENPQKRRQFGQNALDTIKGRYDWYTLSQRLEHKYYELMGCAANGAHVNTNELNTTRLP